MAYNNPFNSSQQMQNPQYHQLMMQVNQQLAFGQNAAQSHINSNQFYSRRHQPNVRNPRNTQLINGDIDEEENVKKEVVIFNLSEPSKNVNGSVDTMVVSEILKAIGVSPNVNLIKRLGHFAASSKPRRILVRFNSESDRNIAVQKAYKLDDYPGWKHIWLRPYLPFGERIVKQNISNQSSSQPSNKTKTPNSIPKNPFVNFASQFDEDPKPINILVIGASGVGKSTWINGIANYMNFNTFDDAFNAEQPVCLISTNYPQGDNDFHVDMEQTVGVTNEEKFAPGQSCTQQPKNYRYVTKCFAFNLIDTPGICDTRGVEIDIENMKKIVECMSRWEEIHGICLLLKPDESRNKLHLRYCFEELLANFHKNSIPNISVVFTSTSETFFRPGGTMNILNTLADEVKTRNQNLISFTNDNTFCIENECVKILYTHHKGLEIKRDHIETFSNSWEHTVNETYRMFRNFTELTPHSTVETKATSHIRNILTELASIMVDMKNEITQEKKKYEQQTNQLKALETKMNEMQSPNYKGECLEKTPLAYPVTVCCGTNCSEIISNERFYKKDCCPSCHLINDVPPENIGHPHEKEDSNNLPDFDHNYSAYHASNGKDKDRETLIKEAEEFGKKFNVKVQNLNSDDRLLFMETFGKSLVLSSTRENCLNNEENNKPHDSVKLLEETTDEIIHDFVKLRVKNDSESCDDVDIQSEKSSFKSSTSLEISLQRSGQNEIQPNLQISTDLPTKNIKNNGKIMDFSAAVKGETSKKDISFNEVAAAKQNKSISKEKINTNSINSWTQKNDKQKKSVTETFMETSIKSQQQSNIRTPEEQKIEVAQQVKVGVTNDERYIPLQPTPGVIKTHVPNVSEHNNDWMNNKDALTEHQEKLKKSNKKSLNILILGETGVGKSTWINAFANYLFYNTLEDAIAAEAPVCVIPTKFTLFDDKGQQRDIIFGDQGNESFETVGASVTQDPKTYFFETSEYNIHLIDTPGTNDTRGNDQNDINMQKILRAISSFKELHAICFLFKPNESRIKNHFRYSINSLLSNLSRSSLENISIIFTNTRGTFYRPGSTLDLLNAYFEELNGKNNLNMKLTDDNVFCLENEAFRFCCAYFGHVKFDENELEDYSESWKHSSKEVERFLKHAARLRPHNTSETLSINDTRTWILQLVSPTIKISDIIQTNLEKRQERIHELEAAKNNIKDLQKRAAVPIISLEIIKLVKPQTVCTSSKCIKYEKVNGNFEPIYESICHKDCTILYGDPSRIPDPALWSCISFDGLGICKKCKCSINDHTRIFFEQRIITSNLETQVLQNSILSQRNAKMVKKELIQNLTENIKKYEQEFNSIMNTMAAFSIFLTQNGISQNTDVFEKYIESLIQQEAQIVKTIHDYGDQKYTRLANFLKY